MGGCFRIGSWLVQPDLNTALRDHTSVHLTPKVMQVLVCLAEHAGEAVPKDELIHTVWPDTFVTDDVLKGSVSELRRVFEDDAREPHIIQTIPKRGYRLIAQVEWINESGRMQEVPVQPKATPGPIKKARKLWRVASVVAAAVMGFAILLQVGTIRTRQVDKGAAQIHSLAVLPLANLSGDPGQEYFSDGLTDTLITDLAQIGSLKVVSRISSMQYKQTKKSLVEIARELNVDGIVEGSVQRSGNRVLVTAQLVHGPTDKHLWANSYQRDMQDVFLLERDVAGDIAEQVQARITTRGQAVPEPRAIKPEALEAYLQGNYYLNRGSGDLDAKKAQRFFQQAADADPGFVRAYVGLAWSHYSLIGASAEDRRIRQAAAEKAVALDPMSPEAHSALAQMKFADWDFHGAEAEWRRAISLSPNGLDGRNGLCTVLNVTLRLEESLSECNIAQMLDPDNDHLSQTFEARRQYDRAIESLERQTRHHPDDGFLHYFLFRDYLLTGMYQKSIDELERSLTLIGRADAAAAVRSSYASSGYQGALRTLAVILERSHKTGQLFLPRIVAEIYAQLGDKDRAFYWLEQGYVHHDRIGSYGGLEFITIEHILDPLTSDRRYKDLLHRIGLPDEEPGHSTNSAARAEMGRTPLPMDPKAVEAFLQGRYHFERHGKGFGDEEKRKAAKYFEQAIAADPNFAPSYNWLALSHELLWLGSKKDIAEKRKAAAKAMQIDPNYADAQVTVTSLKWQPDLDWAGTEANLRRIVALDPNSGYPHSALCMLLEVMGHVEEGLRECKIALRIDQFDDDAPLGLYYGRDYDDSIAIFRALLQREPDTGIWHCNLFPNYAKKAMYKEAVEELAQCYVLYGHPEAGANMRRAFANLGYHGALQQWARETEHLQEIHQAYLPGYLAEAYGSLGDKDRAFYWLEQAYEHREEDSFDDGIYYITAEPMYDPLRADPRFNEMVRKVGLTAGLPISEPHN